MQYCRHVAKWDADISKRSFDMSAFDVSVWYFKNKRNVKQRPEILSTVPTMTVDIDVKMLTEFFILFWATLGGMVQTHLRFDWTQGTSGQNNSQWNRSCSSGLNQENSNRRAAFPYGEPTSACANINEITTESIKYGFWLHEICRLTKSR